MGTLYDEDLVLWSEQQARALREAARAGWNAPVDWENVAEEIESLGRSDRRALASHIAIVMEHLLKLEASPTPQPGLGWRETVVRARGEIETLLADSPSLKREVGELVVKMLPRARAAAHAGLLENREQPRIDLDQAQYTEDQVLGDWLPEPG